MPKGTFISVNVTLLVKTKEENDIENTLLFKQNIATEAVRNAMNKAENEGFQTSSDRITFELYDVSLRG